MTFPKGQASYYQNGISTDLFNVPLAVNTGVYDSPFCFYEWIPAAVDTTLVAAAQTCPAVGANLNLKTNLYQTPNAEIYSVQFDCPRSAEITLSAVAPAGLQILVTGYDRRYVDVQELLTIPTGTIFSLSLKAFYGITSVQIYANPNSYAGQISVGTNNWIGLPYFACLSQNHIIKLTYGTTSDNPYADFLPPANWRVTVPSLTSFDCKGLINLPSNPNGSTLFTILYWVAGADSRLQADLENNVTSAYQVIGAPNPPPTTSPYPANTPPPLLVQEDETGIQYPGNMTAYNQLMNIGRFE